MIFTKARGEYSRWAAHDNVLAPTLLGKCVQQPDVVLCYTEVVEGC